jgi:superfamily II DNA or RNA helicase
MLTLRFDRGTLLLEGDAAAALPGVIWDARVGRWRGAAHRYAEVLRHAASLDPSLEDSVAPRLLAEEVTAWTRPTLRPYQDEALRAWKTRDCRGVVVLPTGAGKSVLAVAAMAETRVPALVLCPTRALLEQWEGVLRKWYGGRIGVYGDGAKRLESITVMTFASAYRHLDVLGDRFGLLVVDEAHHCGGQLPPEVLEMCVAPRRLGLTATAPAMGTAGEELLGRLVGSLVYEVAVAELLGVHLADLEIVRVLVRLTDIEAAEYERLYRPFAELRSAFARAHPEADYAACVRTLARSRDGRRALSDHRRAVALASFPARKREALASLLARHVGHKLLAFTGSTEDAYAIGREHLVPVITSETAREERREILDGFRDGRYTTVVAARVLNEGIDVPDASVGVVVAGGLGEREHVQRVGRVLRPAPGKRALVYELVTVDTVDDARSRSRGRKLVTREVARA